MTLVVEAAEHIESDSPSAAVGSFGTPSRRRRPWFLAWAHALHFELVRLFWHFPEREGFSGAAGQRCRDEVGVLLGWLPDEDSLWVALSNMELNIHEYSSEIPETDHSPEATAVREAIEMLRAAATELRGKLVKEQQSYREAGWLNDYAKSV